MSAILDFEAVVLNEGRTRSSPARPLHGRDDATILPDGVHTALDSDMAMIFISYRRSNANMAAGRLRDALTQQFGERQIFRDIEGVPRGDDWRERIEGLLSEPKTIVLALIGAGWATEQDRDGHRLLDNTNGGNRLELESALREGLPMIPVLIGEAQMPSLNELPHSLRALCTINAVRLRDGDWDQDVQQVIQALARKGASPVRVTFRITLEGTLSNAKEASDIVQRVGHIVHDLTLTLKRVEAGSIVLLVEGSVTAVEKLTQFFNTKELTEINGHRILQIERMALIEPELHATSAEGAAPPRRQPSTSFLSGVINRAVDASDLAGGTANTQGVELKVTVSEQKEQAAADAFGLDPSAGERRRIFFFDSIDLALFQKGLVLRAREVKGGKDDSTVKLRPVDPKKLDVKWHRLKGFKIEADGVGDKLTPSASLSVEQGDGEIKAVEKRLRAIDKLFSPEQEELLNLRVPVTFKTLLVLGPVDALRWNVKHEALPFPIIAEQWTLPDKHDLLELSIKVPTAQASVASVAFDTFLRGLHLKPQGGQEAKTRVALEFFVKRVRA